jgi:prephenate dehydratase
MSSQNVSSKNIIAFQGVEGAHSDLACRQAYPYMQPKAYENFEDVFKAVEAGEAEIGLIPIGNSYAGRVAEIHNLLPKTKLSIVGEFFLRIEHNLLGVKGATKESIKEVYSHPQALMQCNEHIKKYGYKTNRHANTAIAAKDVASWNDTSKAAIASSLAGELYGLEIIEQNFEDDSNNTTLFLAFSQTPIDPEPKKGSHIITSMLFTTRNIPAGLYKALGGFATNNVNIIKLESYIPETESAQAQFFISFEGSPNEKNVQLAIEELGFFTKKTKLLGVYNAHKARRNLSE